MFHGNCVRAALFLFVATASQAWAAEAGSDTESLAKAAQNPVANMISLPFQNNTDFNFGPDDDTLNTLNIQPVLPFSLNENWNIITRTIIPVVSQPGLTPGQDRETGLGDTSFSAFFSPAVAGKLIWGCWSCHIAAYQYR